MSVEFVIYLSVLLLISAFGIVKYGKLTIPFKLLVILMPITFATELCSHSYFNTSEVHYVYYLCEYILIASMYYFLLRAKIPKNMVLISMIAMAVFIVLNALIWQPFKTTFPSNVILPSQILYTLFAFLSLGQLLFDQQQVSLAKLAKQSIFWFNIAILVFACATFIPLGLVNYFAKHPDVRHNITDNFLIVANYLFYLMVGLAIWLEAASPIFSVDESTSFENGYITLEEGWGEALRDDAIYVGFVLTVLIVAGVYSRDMIIAHSLLAIILWMTAFVLVVCGTLIASLKNHIKLEQKIVKVKTVMQGKLSTYINDEIYNNVLQLLSIVKMRMHSLADKSEADIALTLNEDAGHLLKVINDLQDMNSRTLSAARIAELGLLQALKNEAEEMNELGILKVAILITSKPRSLGEEDEVVLFRIFQVIIHHTLNRTPAQNFEIIMDYTGKGFVFILQDDAPKHRPEGADPSKAVSIRAKVTLTPRVGGGYHMVHEVQLN